MSIRKVSRAAVTAVMSFFLATSSAHAFDEGGPGCYDAEVLSGKIFSGVCWSCVFPIILSKLPISADGADRIPPGAADSNVIGTCST